MVQVRDGRAVCLPQAAFHIICTRDAWKGPGSTIGVPCILRLSYRVSARAMKFELQVFDKNMPRCR